MRYAALVMVGGLALMGSAGRAEAATVYVYIDAMTLEQRGVKIDMDGPDRAYLCMLPPATSGCQEVPLKRKRG